MKDDFIIGNVQNILVVLQISWVTYYYCGHFFGNYYIDFKHKGSERAWTKIAMSDAIRIQQFFFM